MHAWSTLFQFCSLEDPIAALELQTYCCLRAALAAAYTMHSHIMNKRRSEVSVAPLRPLALNRATTEILPYRGTLFLKVIKGTQLVQAPKLPPPRKSMLGAQLSAFLGDGSRAGAEAGDVMHAVSVTSWLTDAEPEATTPDASGGGGDSPGVTRSATGEALPRGSESHMSREGPGGRASSGSPVPAGAGGVPSGVGDGGGAMGGGVRSIPGPGAARTSPKFIGRGDADGGASWEEEFFFGTVSGDIAVRIVCIDKPLREGAEDEVVGELLIPVSRLPQNEPVEQWYGLEPPLGSGRTFTKAALLLRFLFKPSAIPDAGIALADSGAAKGLGVSVGAEGSAVVDRRQWGTLASMMEGDRLAAAETAGVAGAPGGGGGGRGAAAVAEIIAGNRGAGQSGSAAADEGFKRALLMGGVTPHEGGKGGGGSNGTSSAAVRRGSWKGTEGPGAGRREEFAVDPSIDPFGADEMEDDKFVGGDGGGTGGGAEDTFAQKTDLSLLRAQQLPLGTWSSTNGGTLHVGAAATEAALALSTDEVLPAGLVDYFLVVGPASDEEGKLRVADYADCGFGSSANAPAAGGVPGAAEPAATALEVESAVLEYFPEEQREDAPFPTKVEWFCFPQGLFLVSAASQPAPHLSSFVRFTAGVRSYGLCLTFYRRVGVFEEGEGRGGDAESNHFSAGAASKEERGESADGSHRGGNGRGRSPPPCRRGSLWCPICLCVLTHVPVLEGLMHWLRMFHWCLVRLEKEKEKEKTGRKGVSRRPSELDAAVFQLTLEVPLPVPGVCAMSTRAFGERFTACPEPEFTLPGIRELPPLSFPLGLLLRALRPKGVLELFAAVLQEGRILLHSTKPALLAAVAEGVFALMYPLQWPYAYVPVLPNCLIEHVESPQPFILGVHTDWLPDIAPDALEELIIVDCDLGSVDGPAMEQLPPPVRRSLTQAIRAVLHGNLGNLDAPVRLSKPEASASEEAAVAAAVAAAAAAAGTTTQPIPSCYSPSRRRGTPASGNGFDRAVGGVGLAAWMDNNPTMAAAGAPGSYGDVGAAVQGGGQKSAEAGDSFSGVRRRSGGGADAGAGGGHGAGGEVAACKGRRGRATGAAARMEGLLRLEFARAMADMLYGFTECLFFLHPDRPIFNGARFLQEYCEESYVPFMSVVIDTLAFKYLLETQDSPPLRPFHEMLDKARRAALKKGGDRRKHKMALVPRGKSPDEPASAGAFDGPFPIVNGFDDGVVVSRSKSFDGTGGDEPRSEEDRAGSVAARGAAGGGAAAALPPPTFVIQSPPLEAFVRLSGGGIESDEEDEEEQVNFNARRGQEGGGVGSGGHDGSGGGSGAWAVDDAAEEVREEEVIPLPSSSNGSFSSVVGAGGRVDGDAVSSAGQASTVVGGFGVRIKKEERSNVRLSDARNSFIGTSMSKGADGVDHGHDRNSVVEADEMASEREAGKGCDGAGAGSRGGAVASLRRSGEVGKECYDSAGDWASDESDGLPAVLAARKKPAAGDEMAAAAAVPRSKGQSAGESVLEEDNTGPSGLSVGEVTAPAVATSSLATSSSPDAEPDRGQGRQENPGAGDLPVVGRVAAMAAAAERRKLSSSAGGGSRGGGSVRDSVAALSASRGGSVRDRVAMFSSRGLGHGGGGDGGVAAEDTAHVRKLPSGSNTRRTSEGDARSPGSKVSPLRNESPLPSEDGETSPAPAPMSYAAVAAAAIAKEKPTAAGTAAAGGRAEESSAAGASKGSAAKPPAVEVVAPLQSELSWRAGGLPPPPPLTSGRRSSGRSRGSSSLGISASVNGNESSMGYGEDEEHPFEPITAPLSRVDWSHKPVLRLGDFDLPQPREWTLADIGKEMGEDLGEALRAQTDGSTDIGLGHGAYSLKAGAGLAAAAAAGAGEGEELDRNSEKLLECLELVYSSDRVSEDVVTSVEETLRTAPSVQKMFLKVLRHASRRGFAGSRGPTLLHGPSFETLARFSYTLLCVCVDRVDYSVAHTLLQLTGNYFQVHEGGGDVFRGNQGGSSVGGGVGGLHAGVGGTADEDGEQAGYFSEFLSARISRHPIFTNLGFWQHVLGEAVQAKMQKIAKDRQSMLAAAKQGRGKDGGGGSLLSSPESPDDGGIMTHNLEASLEFRDPALASEIVCRQVKVFLYEMASIGMRVRTAQRYVDAVSQQYNLQPSARNRLSETVRHVWNAVASSGSPPIGSELTAEMSAAHAGWSQAKLEAAADVPGFPPAASSRSAATSVSSSAGAGTGTTKGTPTRSAATPNSGGGLSTGRPNSASSAFSAGTATGTGAGTGTAATMSRLPALRLSASELVEQLQAESSPSPRMPTASAPGSRGRFRSPGAGGTSSRSLSATYSPSSGGGGIRGRGDGGGSGRTTPSSLSPQTRTQRSRTQSPGAGPAEPEGGASAGVRAGGGAVPSGTWAPGSAFGGGDRGPARGSDRGKAEAALSPRRPLVGAKVRKDPAVAAGMVAGSRPMAEALEEVEEAPTSSGPASGGAGAGAGVGAGAGTGAGLARRFFFGGTETMRSLAASLSPPEPAAVAGAPAAAAAEPSTLPASPHGGPLASAAPPPLGHEKSALSSSSLGGEGRGWAEMVSGGKGELPSLLAPIEVHGRDGEGPTHQGPILCLAAFESRACAGSTDGTVSVYDLSLVSRVGILSGHTGPVTTVSCGDDWVLSGSSDASLRLWQSGSDSTSSTTPPRRGFISLGWQAPAIAGTFKSRVLAGHQGPVTCSSAHPRRVEGRPWLAISGGEDSQIRMWDLRTRRCRVIFTGHSKAITCLSTLRQDSSNLVLSGAKDCTVRLWDINEASGCKAIRKFSGHEGSVEAVLKIGPFAAVSCSNDRTLRTWDHRVKSSVGVLRGHNGPVTCVQQMPANRSVLASGSADGAVMMWDVRATAKGPSYTLRGHTHRVTGLLASGGSVYSCSEDASLHEWEWETGLLKSKFFGNRRKTVGATAARAGGGSGSDNSGISCLAGTGSAVLTAGWDKIVRLWPRSSPTPQTPGTVEAAAAAAAAAARSSRR